MNKKQFERGFFLTDDDSAQAAFAPNEYWEKTDCSPLHGYIHCDETLFQQESPAGKLLLIGHAYNPVRMQAKEEDILQTLNDAQEDEKTFQSILGELTGIYCLLRITPDFIDLYGDASCMQTVFYGIHQRHLFIASHSLMLEDVCHVPVDSYIRKLVNYRFYPLFGRALPGDLSPYCEFARLISNHRVRIESGKCRTERYFPTEDYREFSEKEIEDAILKISQLLSRNLTLIAEKWKKPAISVTGGCDSKTTLAAARDVYDKFSYFSYDSSDTEKVDADAAGRICAHLGLPHTLYVIPREDSAFSDFEETQEFLQKNSGNIGGINRNDVRKRSFFADKADFDVEVKSWVSECGRAYYNKRFAKKHFPERPTPGYCSLLYKVFYPFCGVFRETNRVFGSYISRYLTDGLKQYPWQELFFWEFRMSSWNGLVISGEHKYSFDITIPYNNRTIIDLLLRMPLDYRMNDTAYRKIRHHLNPKVDETGISVVNIKHTNTRAKWERCYLEVLSRWPSWLV